MTLPSSTKVREWEHFYNFHRPHAALGGQTPYERLRQKTGLSVSADTVVERWSGARDLNPGPHGPEPA